MKIFEANLPLVLVENKDSKNENKYQAIFSKIALGNIFLDIPKIENKFSLNQKCHILFYLDKHEFEFETLINSIDSSLIGISKPATIKRRKIREGMRLPINLLCLFTIWTQEGRFEGTIINLSTTGCRLMSLDKLRENSIVTLSFKIRLNGTAFKIITQAIVKWCNQNKDLETNKIEYESGIKFTTLSKENLTRINKLVFSN